MIEVCLLGCGGMAPLPERRLTSMLIRYNGRMILIDCGEGTQIGIKLKGWGFKNIDALCLTHYHADHVAGLPGFLLTLGNNGRTEPFTIFGLPPLRAIIDALTVIAPWLPYELLLKELPANEKSNASAGDILICSAPMDHMIPCLGYSFEVRRAGKFDLKRAEEHGIPKRCWSILQNGENAEHDGRILTPDMVMGPPRKGMKVSYCTDTRPNNLLLELCHESDLLICEGMYGDDKDIEKAIDRKHMTFSEAASIAAKSCSKELWLTHFSPSLKIPEAFHSFAKDIFLNTVIGQDLMTKQLNFIDS